MKAIADMEAAEQEKKAEVMRQEEQYALSLQVCRRKQVVHCFNCK